jgi:elongation factor P
MTVATQLKTGNTIELENNLYLIIKMAHITPGKGNAVVQVDLRNIKTGVKTNKRFRSSENIQTIEIRARKMQYLYQDGDIYHFMDNENYEQVELSKELLADSIYYILPEHNYEVSFHEDTPLGIELPARMTLKITETDPAQKGAQGKTKPATLETGLKVKVPLFIEEGESVIINSEGDYMERAKS